MSKQPRVPSYRHHKSSGQAVVTINGRDFYLGKFESPASHDEYERLIAKWQAGHGTLPTKRPTDPIIVELLAAFLRHAQEYHTPEEQRNYADALRLLRKMYGQTPINKFGPVLLQAVRQRMIDLGLSRKSINRRIARIKNVFKWGVANELVAPDTLHKLQAVAGLQPGRSKAVEREPVQPIDDVTVAKTVEHLPPVLADMVRLQRLTGARPAEICAIKPRYIDRSRNPWAYRPAQHKSSYRGRDRVIFFGPRSQGILAPYLLGDAEAYCFRPVDSEAAHNARRRAERKSPLTPSQARRKRKRSPKRTPGDCYSVHAYRRAIHRACDRAGVARWSPHRLRHSAGTEIRAKYGLEASQVVLGHAGVKVTEIYAERDQKKAAKIMSQVG